MRAGKLDRVITLERATETIDGNGTPQSAWAPIATMRADVIEASTDEFIRGYGAEGMNVVVFRTRFIEGITVADRVAYDGAAFDIKGINELGRRRGLELRTERAGP